MRMIVNFSGVVALISLTILVVIYNQKHNQSSISTFGRNNRKKIKVFASK